MSNLFPYSNEAASRILNCSSPRPGFIPPIRAFERFKRTEYVPVKGEIKIGSKSVSQDSVH